MERGRMMSKYTLKFTDTSFVEYTEEDFNNIPDINITGLVDNEVVKGKILRVRNPQWKYEAEIVMPIDNFEVSNDMENK